MSRTWFIYVIRIESVDNGIMQWQWARGRGCVSTWPRPCSMLWLCPRPWPAPDPAAEHEICPLSAHPATLPPRLGSWGRGHRAAARPPRGQGHECRVSGHTRAVTPRRAARSRELLVTRVTFLPYARYKISLEISADTGPSLAPHWPAAVSKYQDTRKQRKSGNIEYPSIPTGH